MTVRTGVAGWNIPAGSAHRFPERGSHLTRYASALPCVEINSSFYRSHRRLTYERWAASTAESFRFAIKCPRSITHEHRLHRVGALLSGFLGEIAGLGRRRGPILVQLPPSFAFDSRLAERFFITLRSEDDGQVVCEPRHSTWFSAEAEALMRRHQIARVVADPPSGPAAESPAGWPGVTYFRLHGSPRRYWSRYEPVRLRTWADTIHHQRAEADVWCIFDNTAAGAAVENAFEFQAMMAGARLDSPSSQPSR